MCDCLKGYVKNWQPSLVLVTVGEGDRDKIDSHIKNKVLNMTIKCNAEAISKPIATL